MFAVVGEFHFVALFVVLGIVFDFFDGFLARLLNVSGELGKQLDSLADMVTSGVAPGLVMFALLNDSTPFFTASQDGTMAWTGIKVEWIQFTGLLLVLAAGYRLAKFNIDTRQSDSFIGLPTPAMSLFVISLPLIENQLVEDLLSNQYVLAGISLVLCYLMHANIRLLALKFKSYGIKENMFQYLLIVLSVLFLIFFKVLAVPMIITVYVLLSIIKNVIGKKA